MKTQVEKSEALSAVNLDLGCQYYAIARYCATTNFSPIGATMFHHAIEMFLKGYLVRTHSSSRLKKIGHNLAKLWLMFKETTSDATLARYDHTISHLDRVELLRYADAMVNEGFMLNVRLGVLSPVRLPGLENLPQYNINVSDLDDIVLVVFAACSVNPKLGFRNTPSELSRSLPASLFNG